jgi:hypothetical protein
MLTNADDFQGLSIGPFCRFKRLCFHQFTSLDNRHNKSDSFGGVRITFFWRVKFGCYFASFQCNHFTTNLGSRNQLVDLIFTVRYDVGFNVLNGKTVNLLS